MGHPLPRAFVSLMVGFAALVPPTSASDGRLDAAAFLRTYAGFSSHDVARAAGGTAIARSLPADSDEAAVGAAVFMAISRQLYLERFRDIAVFKRNPSVISIGRFTSSPTAADMRDLSLDEDDVEAFRHCQPGDCDVRLDAKGITRLQAASLKNGGANQSVSADLREHLAAYAADYMKRGDAALMEYHDEKRARGIANELALIIRRSPYFDRELSAIRSDVVAFPGLAKSTNDHMLYWSTERIAGTPTISLTHAVIATKMPGITAIATRQIYASHFFRASLGLTLVVDAPDAKPPGVMVIYINRSRVDAFSGILGPVKRAAVRSRARSTAERLLGGLRHRLEGKE